MDSSSPDRVQAVQHVNRKSSEELLRKFSDSGDEEEAAAAARKMVRAAKRRKRNRNRGEGDVQHCESPLTNGCSNSLVERRSLLTPATRKSKILRQLGIGRSQLRVRDFKNKSLLGTIEKTWRRTVEGASRVLLDKHYNRHRRLINDAV